MGPTSIGCASLDSRQEISCRCLDILFTPHFVALFSDWRRWLFIDCQTNGHKERQMTSKTNTNPAMPAHQGGATQETAVEGKYASVGDLRMYYEIHGAGRPLVLLHGAFMSATVYPTLAEGRQVIAVDLQGHGRTADIDRPLSYEQMADDTAALLQQLAIEQTDVFGYSLGGKVGLALAIRHPDLVRRLAIFGAAYRSFEESFAPDVLTVFKEATPEAFAPKALQTPYEKLSPSPNWIGLAAKILHSVRNFRGFSPEQMKAIKAEVFIGAGDHNDVSLEDVVEMHKLIPKSQLAVFPNTEHVVVMTNPDKVLGPVREFLNAH
jgi:pimeloyl-ACP methyl ester carboxylesterase